MTVMALTMRSIATIQMSIYPGAPEVENDGIDQDCDGSDLVVAIDNDGDGFDETVDCDDSDASVYPSLEIADDGIDQDVTE